jgi:hypothetical protein
MQRFSSCGTQLQKKNFSWIRVAVAKGNSFTHWVKTGYVHNSHFETLEIIQRTTVERYATWLSRAPVDCESTKYCLGDLARVMRGIATEQNNFFFMTSKRV